MNVQSLSVRWSGRFGWKRGRKAVAALIPEFRLDGTPGLYTRLGFAPSCVTSTATLGGNCSNSWCAQIGPGGRPSIGPNPPPSSGGTGCCVVLASFVGAGLRVATAFRGKTSNRGIGWLDGWMPKSGLGGAPVGIPPPSAYTLVAKGLTPLIC